MSRIKSLDLARGFTVLFFAPVHAVLLFSKPEVYNTPFGLFLTFIAEDIGAQVFMLLMGISFVLSKRNDFNSVIKKVAWLLAAGYVLNFLKFVLPAMSNILPAGVYTELQVSRNCCGYIKMLLTGDILQFAAIAMFIIYAVSRLPRYPLWASVVAIVICFVSPLLYDKHGNNAFCNYLLQLVSGQPPRVFFPLLPWLVYPLTGLVIGYFIRLQKPLVFGYCMMAGFILMLLSCSEWLPYHDKLNESFYRTYPPGTLYHLGMVLVWLYIVHWIAKHHPHRLLLKPFSFLSKHITLIYCVQWIILCWSLPLIGFRTLGTMASIIIATLFCLVVIIISALILLFV